MPQNHRKCPSAKADMKFLMSSLKIHNEQTMGMPAHTVWFPEISASKRKDDSAVPGLMQKTDELGFSSVFCFYV